MRGSTRSRRSPGWRRPLRSVETESSGSTWMCYWNRFAPIRASSTSCAAWACPRSSRSSIARSAMKTHRARQGMKILLLLFVLGMTVPGRAQLGNEGSIEGIVTDPSGAVIPGVMLCVKNPNTSDTFNTTTNELGLFRFPCAAWACPRSSRSSIARSAMKTHRARQGMKILLLLFELGLSVPGRAQLGNEGSIEGIVTDPSGAVIPGVMLCVKNPNTSDTFNTTTNELGLFRFPVLPVGSYELVAEHPGFASLIQKNVVVNIGAEVNLTLSLRLATGTETVVVKSETPLLESTRSQVSSIVDARSVANLPLNGRNFLGFVFLTPGVTLAVAPGVGGIGPSIGGQRGMNSYLLDGADNNQTFLGGPLDRKST